MDGRRDSRNTTRTSSDRSRASQDSGRADKTPSPKFLTSFPSFSPQDTPRSKKKSPAAKNASASEGSSDVSGNAAKLAGKSKSRAASSPVASRKNSTQVQPKSAGTSAMNRTVQAASNLRATILNTITSRQSSQRSSTERIFTGGDEETGDPLAGATDEHIERIINSSGGPIATVKKYSAELTETNERVTAERNSKVRLVEENRVLRTDLKEKDLEIEDLQRRLATTKRLFERYVGKMQPELGPIPQVQILESPAGPYALEDSSSTILATADDDFIYPESSSMSPSPGASTPASLTPAQERLASTLQLGKSMDTIRPKKQSRAPRLPQRLASAIKTEAVEMKSPVDMSRLPPALREPGTPSEGLVDRLGFYITADREKRHQEAAQFKAEDKSESSSIDMNLRSDDESVLSMSELLCDAPTGPPTKLIFRSESNLQVERVFIEVDKTSSPAEITTVTGPITPAHAAADIAPRSDFISQKSPLSPFQDSRALTSLLVKLTEAYDMQQKKRTNEWASFYEHARDLVLKGSEDTVDEQGVAGVAALCSASNVSPETRLMFNGLIRKGVPVTFRREVWLERSGANNIRDSEIYHSLVREGLLEGSALHEISIDVERTLSNNVFFREGVGKARLRDVLIAFAHQNPQIGYSQGLNIIVANLLLMVSSPEDAFALLQVLVKDILPSQYYNRDGAVSGPILERDGQVLDHYVQEYLPSMHKHLQNQGAPLTMFTPGWLISAFASCVNGEALYRLWDLIFGFCDGRFVFCFALALLKLNRRGLMACRSSEDLMSYLGGKMSTAAVSLDTLINETFKMGEKVTISDIQRRRTAVTANVRV